MQAAAGSLITEMKVWRFRLLKGTEVPLRWDAVQWRPTGTYHPLFIWKGAQVFFRKITCQSSVGFILGLFGTTTPPKFILSHVSYILCPQPALPFAPQCLLSHLSLATEVDFFHSLLAHLFTRYVCFTFHAAAVFEFQLDTFWLFCWILVEWNASKCGEGREK